MYLAVQELAQRTTMVRALASVATSRSPARDAALQGGAWLVIKRTPPAYWASRSRRPRDPVMGVIRWTGAASGWLTGRVTGREGGGACGDVFCACSGVCCSAGVAERAVGLLVPGRGDAAAEPGGVGQVEPAGGNGGAELREEPGG
jgi:hypothetical protein